MHASLIQGKKGGEEEEEVVEEKITSVFVPSIEASVHEFVAKWQDRDETDNFFQKYDQELVKDELRPIVFEEVGERAGGQRVYQEM
jgi:hypothetical protein